MKRFPTFRNAIEDARRTLVTIGYQVPISMWQSTDVSKKPEMRMREVRNYCLDVPLGHESLDHWREDIQPNLPWADRHFELERVSGHPINPGETWKEWPYGHSADKFRTEGEQFSHSYAERYWPKYAGKSPGGWLTPADIMSDVTGEGIRRGIRYRYGDLDDVVDHLAKDPLTRQAYLPVWFPEDTGTVHGERVPCTLGYHWMRRMGYLHTNYIIRSCDIVRHFQDDIYLTVRLTLWLLNQLRKKDAVGWGTVKPGSFSMVIFSLHCFENDFRLLCKES